jgi:hypothetical protein
MITQFIQIQLSLAQIEHSDRQQLHLYIDQQLSSYGVPLRWAIVELNAIDRVAKIEAIVTQDSV